MTIIWIVVLLFYFHHQALATVETFECIGVDACKKETIQCKSGSDCSIICNGKTACLDVMVIGLSARNVRVICTPEDTCKGGTVLCGAGHCSLDCMAANGKSICDGVTVHLNDAISFQCPNQCPSHIAPLIMTAAPTTTIIPTTSTIPITTAMPTTATPTIPPVITAPSATSSHPPTNHVSSTNYTTLSQQSSILSRPLPTTVASTAVPATAASTAMPKISIVASTTIPIPTTVSSTDNPMTHTPTALLKEKLTETPTMEPTNTPTWIPTVEPTTTSSTATTSVPTEDVTTSTTVPTLYPTTNIPTNAPTDTTTSNPTNTPTVKPTHIPSVDETSTAPIISSTHDMDDNVHIDDRDNDYTLNPLIRPNRQNITRARPNINAEEENVTIIEKLENIHILWYISTAGIVILCCSLLILIAFCLSVEHDIKSVESELSHSAAAHLDLADLQSLKIKPMNPETYCLSPIEHEYEYEFQLNEDHNSDSNAESSDSETTNEHIEYEDYEDYDEYDELREGSECTPMVKHVQQETSEQDPEEKQMQIQPYSIAIDRTDRARPAKVYAHSKSSLFPSFPSVLTLPTQLQNNPFFIEPLDDDNEQELEYDTHYLKISALRGRSLSVNPEISVLSDSVSQDDHIYSDAMSNKDVTDYIEHLESETIVHINDNGLIPPIFNPPISQVTLDREPSCDQSPTLNSMVSQISDVSDSLLEYD